MATDLPLKREQRKNLDDRISQLQNELGLIRCKKAAGKQPAHVAAAREKVRLYDAGQAELRQHVMKMMAVELRTLRNALMFGDPTDHVAAVVKLEKEAGRG